MTRVSGRLERVVRAGRFVVTAEVVPPRSADPGPLVRQARGLVGYADAVNVTDNPAATAHMSPLAGVWAVAAAGIEPTLQLTTRDRNRLALEADLLGAWALGARNLLCLSGDPIAAGDPSGARDVRDLGVLDLIRMAATLGTEGRLPPGDAGAAPRFYIGVADSPLVEGYDPGRLEAKLDAGASFVQTQIAFDVDALGSWVEAVRGRGIPERAAVFAGVAPVRSAEQARYLNERLPGVAVPPSLVRDLEGAGPQAETIGVAFAVRTVRALRAIEGVAGVHLMGLGREAAVRRVVEAADLLPRPTGAEGRAAGRS